MMHTKVETQVRLIITTTSLQRALQISKLAKFEGEIQLESPNHVERPKRSNSKQVIISLLQEAYTEREFSYAEAKALVETKLNRGGSTTRLVLLHAIKKGLIRRIKNGVYSFVSNMEQNIDTEASYPEERTVAEVAPNVM